MVRKPIITLRNTRTNTRSYFIQTNICWKPSSGIKQIWFAEPNTFVSLALVFRQTCNVRLRHWCNSFVYDLVPYMLLRCMLRSVIQHARISAMSVLLTSLRTEIGRPAGEWRRGPTYIGLICPAWLYSKDRTQCWHVVTVLALHLISYGYMPSRQIGVVARKSQNDQLL